MAIYIDNVKVNIAEACKLLGIDKSLVPKHKRKVMQMPTRVIDDKGTRRSSKSYGGRPEFRVYVSGQDGEVTVRWAESQRKERDKTIYTPNTLWMLPAEDGSVIINKEDEFFFRWVCPACKDSPFHVKGTSWDYEYQDKDSEAEIEMAKEQAIIDAMAIIIGNHSWPDFQLKQLAKGLGEGGVDEMSMNVIKKKLRDRIYKDPVKFYSQATSREVMFNGKIQEAIDRNIIQLKSLNGMQRWYFQNEELLPISHGQQPRNELIRFMAENWFKYDTKIKDALNDVNISSLLNRPENDAAFEGLKIVDHERRADLSAEEIAALAEWRKDEKWEAKMRVIDEYDKSDPAKMHPAQLKSWQNNKEAFDLWKREQELQAETV